MIQDSAGYLTPEIDEAFEAFRRAWDAVQKEVTATAQEKGFYSGDLNPCRDLLLMHSEISEASEALRHGNPPDQHLPHLDSISVEMADLIIRMMAYAEMVGLDIPRALFEKKAYNKTRPYKHGKNF
jgi:NTP pyrophosphatase (non-canonical NTP hydrolase)